MQVLSDRKKISFEMTTCIMLRQFTSDEILCELPYEYNKLQFSINLQPTAVKGIKGKAK